MPSVYRWLKGSRTVPTPIAAAVTSLVKLRTLEEPPPRRRKVRTYRPHGTSAPAVTAPEQAAAEPSVVVPAQAWEELNTTVMRMASHVERIAAPPAAPPPAVRPRMGDAEVAAVVNDVLAKIMPRFEQIHAERGISIEQLFEWFLEDVTADLRARKIEAAPDREDK